MKAKFHVEPPWEGGTKDCMNGQGHMIATPKYLKKKTHQKYSHPEPEVL